MNSDLLSQFQGMKDQMLSGQSAGQPTGGAPSPTEQPVQAPAPGGLDLVELGGQRVAADIAPQAQQIMAQHPSLTVVSGHRDKARNQRENGVDRSWHLKGRAVDFKGPLQDLYKAAAAAKLAGADESLVHNAGEGMILHVAWAE